MKEELKTLKNIKKFGFNDRRKARGILILEHEERIKAEVVKWVKKFREDNDSMGGLKGNLEINFIKLFFNLTEEDLK